MKNKEEFFDGYVDSISLRIDFVDKNKRDLVYSELLNFIKTTKLVGLYYDKGKSTQFFKCTKLISSNTTIGDISKSGYPNPYSKITNYYVSINFYGLKRHIKDLDEKSELLLKNVMAFINKDKSLVPMISQLDICMDMPYKINNTVIVPINRKSRKKYHDLGKCDNVGNRIQMYKGTFYVEKFTRHDDKKWFTEKEKLLAEIRKRRNNVQKRAYLYDKRKQLIDKSNYNLGYSLTRFEMKLQNRYFLNNKVSIEAFLRELKDYKVLYFEDLKEKDNFTKKYNKANSNKERTELIEKASLFAITIKTNLSNIDKFIRMIDTITFSANGKFKICKKENYIYGTSRFNRK